MHPLSQCLLEWYDSHRRDLPWRAPAGVAAHPYHVWLSEIMLQQTTVQAVKPYYEAFLARWPTVVDLAKADLHDILDQWAGLGYYARARNLHACAIEVVDRFGGHFPEDVTSLKSLPGIGDYTAGAIAAIAFDRKAVAVDGNVERVISRLYRISTPLPRAKKEIKAKTYALLPQRSGDFAQALMDLGATVCMPRTPLCHLCVWKSDCAAYKAGDPGLYPVKAPKKERPTRYGLAFWLESGGHVLLRRRPPKGLLGGMLEVPSTHWGDEMPTLSAALSDYSPVPLDGHVWHRIPGDARHTFTHFHLHLGIAVAEIDRPDPRLGLWVKTDDLEGLPSLMRKVAALAMNR